MGMPTKLIVQLLQLAFLLVIHLHLYRLLHGCAADSCSIAGAASNTSSCSNNISTDLYPFAFTSSPSCAFSPSFLLSDCSSNSQHAAYWNSFTDTIPSYDISHNIIGPPAVMGISRVNSSTYINVTWDSDLISEPSKYNLSVCSTPPVPLQNLSHAFPSSIDLGNYANSSVIISDNNVYLLFNCSHSTTSDLASYNNDFNNLATVLEANTPLCQAYRSHCTINYTCVQLIVNFAEYYSDTSLQQLNLQDTMDKLNCTHFQFFATKTGAAEYTAVAEWGKAILQLQWTDPNCSTYCYPNNIFFGGSCVFDSTNHTFEKCENCKYGEDVDGFCKIPSDCDLYDGRFSICHTRTKIAVSVVVIVGTALLLLALCYCRRIYRRRRSMQKSVEKLSKFPWRNSAWPQDLSSGSNESLDINVLSERPMEFSYSSIASATSSFSSKIGKGGFGAVFKGELHDDQGGMVQEIAVKVLEVRSKHSRKQFLNEVAIIGRIHHVNVVRLLGFCEDHEEQYEMLVYEYVVNGSLDTWLFNSTGKRAGAGELDDAGSSAEKVQLQESMQRLEWGQRYGIALGVARGLSYLHEECRHRIVHCDIKPHNILLDASMCPKIADFGLARLMNRDESRVVTLAKGTPGYMAPEFWVGGDIHLSTKADVYSYGMVLLEIVSGRRNFALGCRRFPALAFEAAMRGDFESVLDVHLLHGTQLIISSSSATTSAPINEEKASLMWQQVRTATFVALWCIQDNPEDRPCMSEVVQYLEGIAMVSEKPPLPVVACTTMTTPLLPTCLNSVALTSTATSELTRIIHGR